VELREYGFKDTGENLPYAVFVSSKVTRDKKAPLVLALHGFSGNHGTFMRTAAVDAAVKGGSVACDLHDGLRDSVSRLS
jgi:predicted peptidase